MSKFASLNNVLSFPLIEFNEFSGFKAHNVIYFMLSPKNEAFFISVF